MCERLLLYIGDKEVVHKIKTKETILKLSYMKNNCSFHDALDHFIFLYFSTACQTAFALDNKG